MSKPSFKDAITICKGIMRNGFDAHIINTQLQHDLIAKTGILEIDLAVDAPVDELIKIMPQFKVAGEHVLGLLGTLVENGYTYYFYEMGSTESRPPEACIMRISSTMQQRMFELADKTHEGKPKKGTQYSGFMDHSEGFVRFEGIPDVTLHRDYLLGIKALRYAANFDLPIEPNTWMAILRSSQRIIDYVPTSRIIEEWRSVAAENMWRFVDLLFKAKILQGIIPELAALSGVRQTKNDTGVEESVLEHTIQAMRHYPEGEFHHDWIGTFAMLFHDIGKLYTGEFYQGKWFFYQHHCIGAQVTRVILRHLRLPHDEIETICHLVSNHMRFQFMMTDRGIRRFKLQEQTERLMAMSRANITAREDNYTAFNHNTKYLARAETPEQMLEPLLNGNAIMEVTGLVPGPHVGDLRQALLKAQIAGEVKNKDEAIAFVKEKSIAMA